MIGIDRGEPRALWTMTPLLLRIDDYFNRVSGWDADRVSVGPLTLFVNRAPWANSARPTPTRQIAGRHLRLLQRRCAHYEMPMQLEWIHELHPELEGVAFREGLAITDHPLLFMRPGGLVPRDRHPSVRILGHDDQALMTSRGVVDVAFDGSMPTTAGIDERDRCVDAMDEDLVSYLRARSGLGRTVTAAALAMPGGPLATGSYHRADTTAEIVGVGTLPAYRRQGLGSDVVHLLCEHAFANGVNTLVLTAKSEQVGALYQVLGFARAGTVMSAHE